MQALALTRPRLNGCRCQCLGPSSLRCHASLRPLKPQAFETEVGWWGSKELNAYRHLGSPPQRIAACQRARG